jgi:DNA polymerase-4
MSKTCFAVHGFATATFERYAPELAGKPYVLIDPAGRVEHASPAAHTGGVGAGMSAHRVRAILPECDIRSMREEYLAETNHAFFDVLAATGLPCERIAAGAGYLDLTPVAPSQLDAREVIGSLGRQLRTRLGDGLVPAIGWGEAAKCVARAAAQVARPGTMRLISAQDAATFLAPLPTTYLPLPTGTVLQLHHLGITTCAGLVALSTAAVRQRWGKNGTEAQRLARGEDARPIRPELTTLPEPVEVDLGGPGETTDEIVLPLTQKIMRALEDVAQPLEGITQLALNARAWDKTSYAALRRFGEPLLDAQALQRALEAELRRFKLSAQLTAMSARILAVGEPELRQLTLFGEGDAAPDGPDALPEGLREKYGPALQRVEPLVTAHPIFDHRYRYVNAIKEAQ